MAQLMSVTLSRFDASPWGFRLQGGKDFGQPLIIQKVNPNSPAEKSGLRPGDALIQINNIDLTNLTHKDAQSAIVKAGNSFELQIQRGGYSTWKPSVVPVGPTPSINQSASVQPVTKTSLAHKPVAPATSFSQYNYAPKPFGGHQVNGTPDKANSIKSMAKKMYNSPIGLYSDQTIAETLTKQAEVLASGVVGVNFMKNEKQYTPGNSELLKMVQEYDSEPRAFETEEPLAAPTYESKNIPTSNSISGVRHVSAPETKPQPAQDPNNAATGQNTCAECEHTITGLFVRIKDKNLHVDCFKCSTCGSSLKNVGYYNINNKLYCDIHAKVVARQPPPAVTTEPIIPPMGAKLPSKIGGTGPPPFQSQLSTSSLGLGSPQPTASVPFQNLSSVQQPFRTGLSQTSSSPFSRPQSGIFTGLPSSNMRAEANQKENDSEISQKIISLSIDNDRLPKCLICNARGPFITALGKIWCPDHFVCANVKCHRPLADIGFVEEGNNLYCEFCFEKYMAPNCDKCQNKIKGDCLNAMGKHYHPECFCCTYCGKMFGNNPFFMDNGLPYCQKDWNDLFMTKCFACGFPIEGGDRWVEALNNNYHSQCFNCSACKTSLEGQKFFAKGGRPFCEQHAR